MPSSTSASKALGLGLGLAIFAGAEQAIWSSHEVAKFLLRRPPAAASGDTFEVASRILLMDRQGPAPLVLLGSSQVREGLDCDILVNGPCLNLGIGGGSPLDMLYVARELGNRPRTLVAITSWSREMARLFIHLPMIISETPPGLPSTQRE